MAATDFTTRRALRGLTGLGTQSSTVVDVKLGVILGLSMFVGAMLGGRIALLLSTMWLRRIFIAAVLGLAVKMLLPDLVH